jgi:hypothetical protein
MNLEHPDFEVLYTRPQRLPRGFPSIITGTVYHPPSSDDKDLLNYLSNSLTEVIGIYPGCGIIIAGDFNRLDINHLCYEFHLKQLVHTPTRGANILDLVLTNLQLLQAKPCQHPSPLWFIRPLYSNHLSQK